MPTARDRPPASTDTKSEEFGLWLEQHEKQADFILAVQQWRQANRLLSVLETMHEREVDGTLHYGLKYFGATHTGRWSGDAGLNLQNLPGKAFAGVDARACLVPRSGKRFIIGDFAQIEARVTCWLAGDEGTLALLRSGVDIYEAHARRTMHYSDPRPLKGVNPDMRQFAKCRVLALGFGLGGGGSNPASSCGRAWRSPRRRPSRWWPISDAPTRAWLGSGAGWNKVCAAARAARLSSSCPAAG